MKLTKQGVRDLGRSKPKKAESPPKAAFICRHARVERLEHGDSMCLDCPMMWDWNGMPYDYV